MKEISCIPLDEIGDTDFTKKCEKELKDISSLRFWVAIIIGPFVAFGAFATIIISVLLFLSENVAVGLFQSAITGIAGPVLSGIVAGFIASAMFWTFEIVVSSSACVLTIVTLTLAYYPIKSALIRNAYVSKRILIADTAEEVRKVALPYIVVFWIFQFFFNKAHLADSLHSAEASYNRGAIVMKTNAFTFAYGSDFIMKMRRGHNSLSDRTGKAEFDEVKMEGIEVKIMESGEYTMFAFRDAIAIVDKKDRDDIIKAIERVDPDALQSKKKK